MIWWVVHRLYAKQEAIGANPISYKNAKTFSVKSESGLKLYTSVNRVPGSSQGG